MPTALSAWVPFLRRRLGRKRRRFPRNIVRVLFVIRLILVLSRSRMNRRERSKGWQKKIESVGNG